MNKLFRTNADNIEDCPLGRVAYWGAVKKDPNFPKPLPGMGKKTEYFNPDKMDAFWELMARVGLPTNMKVECSNLNSLSDYEVDKEGSDND